MPSVFDRILLGLSGELRQLRTDVSVLQEKVNQIMVKQTDVDATVAAISKALDAIRQDIADLKATTPPVGEPMTQENFDKITALAAKAEALDAENPPAPTEV